MAINCANIGKIIKQGLDFWFDMTPEEQAAYKAKRAAENAAILAKLQAEYAAMTPEQQRAYDDEAYGMMPRLAGASEYWARRAGDDPKGGR